MTIISATGFFGSGGVLSGSFGFFGFLAFCAFFSAFAFFACAFFSAFSFFSCAFFSAFSFFACAFFSSSEISGSASVSGSAAPVPSSSCKSFKFSSERSSSSGACSKPSGCNSPMSAGASSVSSSSPNSASPILLIRLFFSFAGASSPASVSSFFFLRRFFFFPVSSSCASSAVSGIAVTSGISASVSATGAVGSAIWLISGKSPSDCSRSIRSESSSWKSPMVSTIRSPSSDAWAVSAASAPPVLSSASLALSKMPSRSLKN